MSVPERTGVGAGPSAASLQAVKHRVAFRGFAQGRRVFEEFVELDEDGIENLLPNLAEKHATAMAAHELHMIEIEFLDEPLEERFFRFGTDPSNMVRPLRVDL